MKTISLKLDDAVFQETEELLSQIKKPRNRYINEAIGFFNKYHKRQLLLKKLQEESKVVSEDSMSILHEFENVEYEDPAI
ncbi:MAG TPA: hypothetical protein DDX92_01220 [Flavobacteriales bacterium]|jgi:hypothetical protein|nr:hypothetical protein [Flavobacteriales bacterium]